MLVVCAPLLSQCEDFKIPIQQLSVVVVECNAIHVVWNQMSHYRTREVVNARFSSACIEAVAIIIGRIKILK